MREQRERGKSHQLACSSPTLLNCLIPLPVHTLEVVQRHFRNKQLWFMCQRARNGMHVLSANAVLPWQKYHYHGLTPANWISIYIITPNLVARLKLRWWLIFIYLLNIKQAMQLQLLNKGVIPYRCFDDSIHTHVSITAHIVHFSLLFV